ncbi:MAG: helix-turn-helix domain-containing protein [Acidimicrobiales bacterium]
METTTMQSSDSQASSRLVLSVSEAAELLGISRDLAYDLAARGELPTLRLGRRIVVPRARLLELIGVPAETSDR